MTKKKTNNAGSMRAVIYARYSSENQREESIEGQLRECYAFARKNDISIVVSISTVPSLLRQINVPIFKR